jgi:hypothetical protein
LYLSFVLYSFIAVFGFFFLTHYLLRQFQNTLKLNGTTKHPGVDDTPLLRRLMTLGLPLGWFVGRKYTFKYLTYGMLYPENHLRANAVELQKEYGLDRAGGNADASDAAAAAEDETAAQTPAVQSELALGRAYELYVEWWKSINGIKQFAVLLLGVTYIYLLTVCSLGFDCFTDPSGVSRLVRDTKVVCTTAAHQRIVKLATAILVIVGGGVPFGYILKVYRLRSKTKHTQMLLNEKDGDVLDVLEWRGLRDPLTIRAWGGLYEAYQNTCVDPFTRAEAKFEMEQTPAKRPRSRSGRFKQRSAAISRNWAALSFHWYAMWLIAYYGERQTDKIVKKLAQVSVEIKQQKLRVEDVKLEDIIILPEAYHPTFNSWWSRLVLRVLVTRYIIRVRLACYYESVNYLMKLCIVVISTASRLGEEKQAFLLVGVYTFFAACTFWVAPYRPVEARIAVHYEPLRLLLFPLFMQVPGWMLSEETRKNVAEGKDAEWKKKKEDDGSEKKDAWFAYYRESYVLENALNLADVTSKLLLAMNILTSTFPTSGRSLFLYDVCLVTLNLLQLAYSLGPVLVRVFGFLSFDFPPVASADDDVTVFGFLRAFGLADIKVPRASERFNITFFDFTFGTPDNWVGRVAVFVNCFSLRDRTYKEVMECINLHNNNAKLAAQREDWSALRKETYKQAFESSVVKVLASYQARKQLLETAIKPHDIRRKEASRKKLAPAASVLDGEHTELLAELERVMTNIGNLVTDFGNTRLGELKDGSSTQWAVYMESVNKLTGAKTRAAALKDDPNRHLQVLTCIILTGFVFLTGFYLSANEPDFFNAKSPPPPPLVFARPPPPRAASG